MFNYLKDGDSKRLISDLKRIEAHAQESIGGENASLWFKFSSDDTAATDIRNIETDLSLPSSYGNHKLMMENFNRIIEDNSPEKELRVFYS